MYHFKNDYGMGANPAVLDALISANADICDGYGEDDHCRRAAELIRELCATPNAEIHFLSGGTQTNLTAIAAFLRAHEGVIAVDGGHIADNETGAIEASGHKIITVPAENGKITPDKVLATMAHNCDERRVKPRLLYISDATETGTIYTKSELSALREVCDRHDLYLYLDGARLAQAIASPASDITLADIAALCDSFYIGGTKNGLLFGEALVIVNDALKPDFRYVLKQRGAMLAKAHAIGIQFEALMSNELWLKLARRANAMAAYLRESLSALGVQFAYDSPTNMLFPIFGKDFATGLERDFAFHRMGVTSDGRVICRLVTSWLTATDECDALIECVKSRMAGGGYQAREGEYPDRAILSEEYLSHKQPPHSAAITPDNYTELNSAVIGRWVDDNWVWGQEITREIYENAKRGSWDVLLTPTKPVPHEWFPPMEGAKVLGLACGGGQQMPIFTVLGAECTVLDYSEKMLAKDRLVAEREGYDIEIIKADMTKRLPFDDDAFDLIFHPISNCYISSESVHHVWRECFRVLKRGGILLAGLDNGFNFLFDTYERPLTVQNTYPFDPLKNPEQMAKLIANDDGIQFSHGIDEQIGGQLAAGFRLTNVFDDLDTADFGDYPGYWATRAVKE
ncbi:MAG: aminotransferase class I/II-fold pyridoxal phosphate-dependent enzyme [Clostridiales bacterium]|jgi:threonine aldolase|nr:aminotransferase class I/II-fold pyridoxal phosphate-dependent enzyme [Clostridiales bacterium]